MRTGNDRSVKTIKFLEQYAKLCVKYDRQIEINQTVTRDSNDGLVTENVLAVGTNNINAEASALIKNLPEA